jgi:hypothetical protein
MNSRTYVLALIFLGTPALAQTPTPSITVDPVQILSADWASLSTSLGHVSNDLRDLIQEMTKLKQENAALKAENEKLKTPKPAEVKK